MNSTSQDALTARPDATPRVDQAFSEAESPELIDVLDPTEDLANDVTSELPGTGPGPGTRPHVVLPQLIGADSIVANDETTDVAPVMTTGAVLRDRYILGQPLGYGGTSVVYRAHDLRRAEVTGIGAEVAIKLLRPEFRDQPHCIARLRREFQQTQSVAHPNVVRFHDLDCDRGNWFIAMELLVGEALGRRLRHESPAGLPTGEALRIAAACGEALAHAHDHGVMHGDIKPDNVFLTVSGEVRMLDFGVAPDPVQSPLPEVRAAMEPVLGAATRAYASPEVLSGLSPEPRDDVFSLTCLIYEMLAGRHPYGRRGADEAHGAGLEIEQPPGISMQRWRALAAGLSWKRDERPQVRELLRALGNDAPEPAPAFESTPVQVVQTVPLRRPSRQWLWPAVIGLAVILGVLIGRFAFDSQVDSRSGGTATSIASGSVAGITLAGGVTPTADAAAPIPRASEIPRADAVQAVATEAQHPLAPGLVAFDAGTMTVSGRAVVAPVPVRHFSRVRRSVTVGWQILDGTAVAGRDYGGPQSGVARFLEGHTFRMIFVPILGNSKASGDRSFTVELTDVSPGASLGMTSRIVVTILDDA